MSTTDLAYPITNKYTFARIFSDPDNARPLLEAVLEVPVIEIRYVTSENVVEPSLRGHGVRMDVFIDDGKGTVIDVEMQNADQGDLALRSRYLLSSFDRDRLTRGQRYRELGRSVVIFVCAFDPIGEGQRMYTVRPAVKETGQAYEDGTLRVFLNALGAARHEPCGESTSRLDAFLSYVDGGDTMGDEWVAHLDAEVRTMNADKGWRDTMLGLALDIQEEKIQAREEGWAEGKAAGMAAGLAEGKAAGLAEGKAAGLAEGKAAGLAEGKAEEAELSRKLAQALIDEGRAGEVATAMINPEVKAQLLAEFGIE